MVVLAKKIGKAAGRMHLIRVKTVRHTRSRSLLPLLRKRRRRQRSLTTIRQLQGQFRKLRSTFVQLYTLYSLLTTIRACILT